MDDTLDYVSEEETLGKAIGKDLNEGKITLPLIYTLQTCGRADQDRLAQIIKDPNRRPEDLGYAMKVVQDRGGIEYTVQRAQEFVDKAKSSLSLFPSSKEKEALLAISDYTVRRKW